MNHKEKILLIFFFFCCLEISPTNEGATNNGQEQWLTVLVHGTVMPYISFFDILKLQNQELQPTLLTRMNKLYRLTPFFYQSQPIQGLGLKPIYFAKTNRGNSAQAFAKTFQILNKKCYPERTVNRYYTFGWSGLLHEKARTIASQALYQALESEVKALRAYSSGPIHITLVGFSHGGNVCIDVPTQCPANESPSFNIDRLVLYGTPIQEGSYKGLYSPAFKEIYNMYSWGDRIQKLDFISGSETTRMFEEKNNRKLPKHLKQISLRFNRRKTPYKMGKEYKEKTKKRVYPGHTELWFFGWTTKWYRPHFLIRPFPVAAFTPFIVKTVNDLGSEPNMTIEISPRSGQTMVTSYDTEKNKHKKHTNCMTNLDIGWLQRKVRAFSPKNYKRQYKNCWHSLLKKARKELQTRKKR